LLEDFFLLLEEVVRRFLLENRVLRRINLKVLLIVSFSQVHTDSVRNASKTIASWEPLPILKFVSIEAQLCFNPIKDTQLKILV